MVGETKNNDTGLANPGFRDVESKNEKLPYPKSVFFIVVNEFCERFSYYGMKAVLVLYLTNILKYTDDSATVVYHVFSMAAYFTPLLGAMIADSWLGKFKTIFYLSIVYAGGNIVLALAATPPIGLPPVAFTILGLGLIALGTGGIKPCVAAFGGDQFILPQQATQLASFFSVFYMSINSGALISTFVTPIIRSDVQCFDQDSCYSFAFALPAALMIVALVVFVVGKFMYREVKPTGNVVIKLFKCIGHAISQKRKSQTTRDHWLDNADDIYEPRFIEDVKIVLRVLVLYLPVPMCWALYDQQGSRWTLQASRMDGVVGAYTIKPDQVQVLNALLILLFIPLFDKVVYPLLAKCNLLKKPLQRFTTGGVLVGIAFIVSGVIELELEKNYPTRLKVDQASMNFINTLPCSVKLNDHTIEPQGSYIFEKLDAKEYTLYDGSGDEYFKLSLANCKDEGIVFTEDEKFKLNPVKLAAQKKEEKKTEEEKQGGGFTYVIGQNRDKHVRLAYSEVSDDRAKPKDGNPKLKFMLGGPFFEDYKGDVSVIVSRMDKKNVKAEEMKAPKAESGLASSTSSFSPEEHWVTLILKGYDNLPSRRIKLPNFSFKLGGSYIITISTTSTEVDDAGKSLKVIRHTITKESSLHMFYLLPQYMIITAGEIMFSITGLEFSYSQAPASMKSVMQSAWLLTVAFGNLIVVIVAEAKAFQEQSKEFFLFAGLLFLDMIWFAFMAWRYVPAKLEDPSKKAEENKE